MAKSNPAFSSKSLKAGGEKEVGMREDFLIASKHAATPVIKRSQKWNSPCFHTMCPGAKVQLGKVWGLEHDSRLN